MLVVKRKELNVAPMSTQVSESKSREHEPSKPGAEESSAPSLIVVKPLRREIGGRDGPEPTRYGDWEKNGRCVDF